MRRALFCLIIFLVLAGLKDAAAGDCDSKEAVRLTKLNSGQEIVLFEGEFMRIDLPSLGSAGYGWYISAHQHRCLELVSKQTRRISPDSMLVGAPEETIWCFKAAQPGWTELILEYYRPWEGAASATDRFELRIMVIRNPQTQR